MFATTVLGVPSFQIVWLFLIYSVLGVVVEGLFCLVTEGVLELRTGMLYLPLRPIYGFGGVGCALLLGPYPHQPLLIFFSGMVIGDLVEYVGAVVVDRALGAKSWDYSRKALNLHGRICLEYSIYWGLLALLVVYVLNPPLSALVQGLDRTVAEPVLGALLVLVLVSGALTLAALSRIGERISVLRARRVGAAPTRQTVWTRLVDRLAPDKILVNSFPRMSIITDFMQLSGVDRAWIVMPAYQRWTSSLRQRDQTLAVPGRTAVEESPRVGSRSG